MNKGSDIRRYREHQRFLQEYDDACLENISVSKSVQKRMHKLLKSENKNAIGTEDTSVFSSLKIFSNNHCICSSCQAMFYKDYLGALFINISETNSVAPNAKSTFLCIHERLQMSN